MITSIYFNVKKVFLKNPQNPEENNCVESHLLIKLHALGLQLYEKRNSDTGIFL